MLRRSTGNPEVFRDRPTGYPPRTNHSLVHQVTSPQWFSEAAASGQHRGHHGLLVPPLPHPPASGVGRRPARPPSGRGAARLAAVVGQALLELDRFDPQVGAGLDDGDVEQPGAGAVGGVGPPSDSHEDGGTPARVVDGRLPYAPHFNAKRPQSVGNGLPPRVDRFPGVRPPRMVDGCVNPRRKARGTGGSPPADSV